MRSRKSVVIGLTVAALLFAGCDWTMYRAGPGRTGSNTFENTITVSNVGTLQAKFTGTSDQSDGAATVANGVLYLEGIGTSPNSSELAAFDANGSTNCSGPGPSSCSPLWTAPLPSGTGHATPAVANGIVYVSAGNLFAYDASGNTNCSGTPKVCSPLWEGQLNSTAGYSSPNVVNGEVYLGGGGSAMLYAFDATGTTNCSGSPKVCQPLWTGTNASGPARGASDSSPAYANGVIYLAGFAGTSGNLYAFDANGATNCSGSPKVCTELWSASVASSGSGPPQTAPAVTNGTVYYANGTLEAFDASGTTGCSGSPKICTPLWTGAGTAISSPAVTNGTVFVGEATYGTGGSLYAFDATGGVGCSGIPKACSPLFNYPVGSATYVFSDVTIANGTVFVREATLLNNGPTAFVALKLP